VHYSQNALSIQDVTKDVTMMSVTLTVQASNRRLGPLRARCQSQAGTRLGAAAAVAAAVPVAADLCRNVPLLWVTRHRAVG
jgi:hypothetical protein